jgi:hypothetical protein
LDFQPEDEEDLLEQHLQWLRAHRFLSVIAKWKKTGERPRAFSDPELFRDRFYETPFRPKTFPANF